MSGCRAVGRCANGKAAFAVKLALWPLHTWVPDAYGAAPTPAAIMLAAVFTSAVLGWPYAAGAALVVVLAAVYALRWFRAGFMGEIKNSANLNLPDLTRRERMVMGALATVVIAGGLFPNLLLSPMRGTIEGVIAYLEPALATVGRLGL